MASINELPDEILSQIFQMIPVRSRKTERKNLLYVSKRWKTLVDSSIGMEIFIGTSPWVGWESVEGIDHININRIQDIGVSYCHVGDLMEIEAPNNLTSEGNGIVGFFGNLLNKVKLLFVSTPFPKFKHPHLLVTFRFIGIIRSAYFEKLITPATTYHLRQLQLNHSSLSLLESATLGNLDLANLSYLEVMADFAYLLRGVDCTRILDNVLTLLQNKFPSLKSCKLFIPFSSAHELAISRIIFAFLRRNADHLKYLEVCYFSMLEDKDSDVENDDGGIAVDSLSELDMHVNETADVLQLCTVILYLNVDHFRCFNHWSRLLSKQRELEYFLVISDRQLHSTSLILQVSNTLRVITATVNLRGDDGQSTPVDCTFFRGCHKLTHLTFTVRAEDYPLMSASPGLINPRYLPVAIQYIDLTGIPILSCDLNSILLTLPQLRYFAGKYLGQYGLMGVTIETLQKVIESRTILWFLLEDSINGNFPDEGISNGHPLIPSFLIVNDDNFCAKICGNGYYVNASPFEQLLTKLSFSFPEF